MKSEGFTFFINRGRQIGDFSDEILAGNTVRASTRLQLRPAFRVARQLDPLSKVESLYGCDQYLNNERPLPRACIFSKIISRDKELQLQFTKNALAISAKMKAAGVPLAILYSDHHAAESDEASSLYQDLLQLADLTIFPSIALQKVTNNAGFYPSNQAIIEDPALLKERPFRNIKKNESLRIIWFGHGSNAKYLIKHLPNIIRSDIQQQVELSILTEAGILGQIKAIIQQLAIPANWTFRLKAWDALNQPFQLQQELEHAQVCWLPSDPTDPRKAGASHNRLVDAVTAGCITIASPIGSYQELGPIALVGSNFSLLLSEAVKKQTMLIEKLQANRSTLLKRFQANSNDLKWESALQSLANIKVHNR